ncbi:3-hydroxyacyl-ACP dehydratase FabZ [Caldisericum exile]|uniref:Beta-hydroxyacyl-[acyl-carrier-protein] dehydratase FabZ n=1 Tax=Caldisericum exile (strain DSM 21853 / NBRC 104410 / AZM16c01) TaxID=511051 RepID=A0A7U6GDE9_CALEA|nr:3-hydroxyacyl-ACP dehydratase FabZ [Caldisericum exile]BAL80305.1 beta-hydroxyacyl-[acyl-carrier-protein] dehydratase FabZ [Caldisericum exile AZM16c01]
MYRNLGIDKVKEILPHREPFLFVDEILEVEPGVRAIGKRTFTSNDFFFKGHFPNFPIVPGVILIEFSAQVSASMILLHDEYKNLFGYLSGVENFKFVKKVQEGDTVIAKCEMLDFRHSVAKSKVELFVNDTLIAMGIIKAFFVNKNSLGGEF